MLSFVCVINRNKENLQKIKSKMWTETEPGSDLRVSDCGLLSRAESAAPSGLHWETQTVCRARISDIYQIIMGSFTVFLSLIPVLSVLSLQISEGPGCGPCDPAQCAPLPTDGCPAGSLLDSCACCSVCAAAEGQLCGGRRAAAAHRCGSGLECVKSDEDKKNKKGVCVCKSSYEVCGTDGLTYRSGCAMKSASLTAQREGKEPINVQNKGRCSAGEAAAEDTWGLVRLRKKGDKWNWGQVRTDVDRWAWGKMRTWGNEDRWEWGPVRLRRSETEDRGSLGQVRIGRTEDRWGQVRLRTGGDSWRKVGQRTV